MKKARKYSDRITKDEVEDYLALESCVLACREIFKKRLAKGAVIARPWTINDVLFELPAPFIVGDEKATYRGMNRLKAMQRIEAASCR